jgi:aminopeptidase N
MRLPVFFLLLIVLVAQTTLAVDTTPVAPVPAETPFTHKYQTQQHRLQESEMKARLMSLLDFDDPGRTANMELYDVTFYDLEMELIPLTQTLTGTTTVVAEVLTGPLAAMDLNLRDNMGVSAVTSGGVAATFYHNNNILTVTLDRTYQTGETVTLAIDYSGNPSSNYFGWDNFDSQAMIWTLSEPYGARYWWPCKDLNTDKADSVDLRVTVPDELIVASNGLLFAETVPAPGKKMFHWKERYPIVPYLVSLAIHPYNIFSHTYTGLDGVTTMPVDHYVTPSYQWEAQNGYAVTVSQLEAFAEAFGEYPFINEKYGHAHFPWGGGMEHQTLSSMSISYYAETFIAHELGHQWFGDMVTCADFHHIWLNEGFATWCEAYWREANEGLAAYREEMNNAAYFGDGTIYVEDPSDFSTIFNYYLSYQKASWVPHMLRGALGDDDFFTALRQYLEDYRYDSATTEQFRDVFEAVSGRDLDQFFQQWIYGEGHPQYLVGYTTESEAGGTRVMIRIEQTQSWDVFEMPLQIRVETMIGNSLYTVENDQRVQLYSFLVTTGQVDDVTLDPNDWVLCQVQYGGTSDVPEAGAGEPRLLANVPNPFNPSTEIRFELPNKTAVSVGVYDLSGRLVRNLVDETRAAGRHSVRWDGRDARGSAQASGLYFVRLDAGGKTGLRKITLIQ